MLHRLRQAAFLVQDLSEAGELYRRVLGMEPCCQQDLDEYGLTSLVLPAGRGTFVELLQPAAPDCPAARFLEHRGEAPYLLVLETYEYDRLVPHLKSLGVRITSETQQPGLSLRFRAPLLSQWGIPGDCPGQPWGKPLARRRA